MAVMPGKKMDWLEKVRANNHRAFFLGILLTKAYLAIISKSTDVTYICKRKSIDFSWNPTISWKFHGISLQPPAALADL